MNRLKSVAAYLLILAGVMLFFALVGAVIGYLLGATTVGAFFGAVIGVWISVARHNSSKAIEHSPEGEDAGYIRGHGGGGSGL